MALVGRSLWRIDKAARENGYLADVPRFLTEDEAGYVPRDRILMICTGSQGEPRSALARIARDDHPNVELEPGDVVIFSSRIIPGNEKAIGRLQNALARLGVEIVTEQDHFVHVSGHPARDELIRMYQMIRPRVAIPVHGEARHLIANADIAGECQVPRDAGHRKRRSGQARPSGGGDRRRSAGRAAGERRQDPAAARRRGAEGPAARRCSTAASSRPWSSTAAAGSRRRRRSTLIGLVEADAAEQAVPFLRTAIERALDELPRRRGATTMSSREAARRALRRALNERFGKRPLIEIQLVRI